MLPETVFNIHGFLSQAEGELLYRLASEVPPGGVIVEIGSFQGRSTVCLGLGAKMNGAKVWAIDPHDDCQINDQTHYGMENHAALLRNLLDYDVADTVRVVALKSKCAIAGWETAIDLLFIDGQHDHLSVWSDLHWARTSAGCYRIVVHDTSGHFPEVTQTVEQFIAYYPEWRKADSVDSIVVLERA